MNDFAFYSTRKAMLGKYFMQWHTMIRSVVKNDHTIAG